MTTQLHCFFIKKKKKIYLQYKHNFASFSLPNMSFFYLQQRLWFFHWTKLANFSYNFLKKTIYSPHRVIVRLNGLNFKLLLNKNYLQVIVGYSHSLYIKLPKGLIIKILDEKKNIFILESFNSSLLFSFVFFLKKVKPINNYTQTGFTLSNEIIKIKIGKKK